MIKKVIQINKASISLTIFVFVELGLFNKQQIYLLMLTLKAQFLTWLYYIYIFYILYYTYLLSSTYIIN